MTREARLEQALRFIASRYEQEQTATGTTPCIDSVRWGLPWAMHQDALAALRDPMGSGMRDIVVSSGNLAQVDESSDPVSIEWDRQPSAEDVRELNAACGFEECGEAPMIPATGTKLTLDDASARCPYC
jgi:hypothetical protein